MAPEPTPLTLFPLPMLMALVAEAIAPLPIAVLLIPEALALLPNATALL